MDNDDGYCLAIVARDTIPLFAAGGFVLSADRQKHGDKTIVTKCSSYNNPTFEVMQ